MIKFKWHGGMNDWRLDIEKVENKEGIYHMWL